MASEESRGLRGSDPDMTWVHCVTDVSIAAIFGRAYLDHVLAGPLSQITSLLATQIEVNGVAESASAKRPPAEAWTQGN